MIHAQHLIKRYGPTLAVDNLSLHIESGQIVGFLGPNGAGKSTTIRMLTGYLPPTSGRATIAGDDVLTDAAAARHHLGYLPESNPLYPEMRVNEYLHFVGKIHGMARRYRRSRMLDVTDRCGLSKLRRRTIGRLSKGNRQRVGIAAALLHEPPVLILDEPTSGLDPAQITHIRALIRELAGKHTILLSSHILPEVERVADRLVIISQARVVADDTVDALRRASAAGIGRSPVHVEARADEPTLGPLLSGLDGVESVEFASTVSDDSTDDDNGWSRVTIHPEGSDDLRETVGAALALAGVAVRELRREAGSLESFFVRVTDTATGESGGQPGPAAPAREVRL